MGFAKINLTKDFYQMGGQERQEHPYSYTASSLSRTAGGEGVRWLSSVASVTIVSTNNMTTCYGCMIRNVSAANANSGTDLYVRLTTAQSGLISAALKIAAGRFCHFAPGLGQPISIYTSSTAGIYYEFSAFGV